MPCSLCEHVVEILRRDYSMLKSSESTVIWNLVGYPNLMHSQFLTAIEYQASELYGRIAASIAPYNRYAPINSKVEWRTCPKGTEEGYECGTFDVPLDYADPSAGKATLVVARYPAPGPARRLGAMFTNPGGPGLSSVDQVLGGGRDLSVTYSDGAYDIVGYDSRGVGLTYPRMDCFNSNESEDKFYGNNIVRRGVEARENFTSNDNTDPDAIAFWSQLNAVDKILEEYGQRCLEANGDNLQYVGTAAVVRYMIALSDALEGPGKLVNYWGFSYGTIIGAYLVNMFPRRVGRAIVDGVVNPVVWATEPAHHVWPISIVDVDEDFAGFAAACAKAGPRACAIANANSTKDSIIHWTKNLMNAAYDYKKAGGEIGSAEVRSGIHSAMYSASTRQEAASELREAWNTVHNLTSSSNKTRSLKKRQADGTTFDAAFYAITCADAVDAGNTTTRDVFQSIIDAARDVSEMFAPGLESAGSYCHKWPARAVARFTGPFNKTTKTPILVIGNEADPITPYAITTKLADALGDSAVLIKQDDFGHCSTADCTNAIIKNFLVNGTYSVEDEFCATDTVLFPQPPVTKQNPASNVDPTLVPKRHQHRFGQ